MTSAEPGPEDLGVPSPTGFAGLATVHCLPTSEVGGGVLRRATLCNSPQDLPNLNTPAPLVYSVLKGPKGLCVCDCHEVRYLCDIP